MNISTFGSCYSRYVANHLALFTNSKIISCTYHNRSDFYREKYFENTQDEFFCNQILSHLGGIQDYDNLEGKDTNIINIIKNQMAEFSGKHRLTSGFHLLECTENTDVFVFDNYMDISAKLFIDDFNNFVFFNSKDRAVKKILINGGCLSLSSMTNLLTAEESFLNFNFLFNHLKEKNPSAFFIYLNFPFNTFTEALDKVRLIKEGEDLSFDLSADLIMPSLIVPRNLQTHQKQHFKGAFYSYVAGRVAEFINARSS